MTITNTNNYFEDLKIGTKYIHVRGRTISEMDNHTVTLMTMNTAQGHFNKEYIKVMMGGAFQERLVMGGLTMSIIIGLTSEDISENAIRDLGYTRIRNTNPVFHGDTLTAETEIISKQDSSERPDAGIITTFTKGYNQEGKQVWEGERTLLVKKKHYWIEKDASLLK